MKLNTHVKSPHTTTRHGRGRSLQAGARACSSPLVALIVVIVFLLSIFVLLVARFQTAPALDDLILPAKI